jgi:hypothetical protein
MFPRLGNSVISLRSRVARTSSVPPQAECIEMETTSSHYCSASRVARRSSVPPKAECIEMDATPNRYHSASRVLSQRISILFGSCLTKSLDDLLQTRTTTTLCKPEHPQPNNSCEDIECSAAGGMCRDGNHIKSRS